MEYQQVSILGCSAENQERGRSEHRWLVYGRWYSDSFNPGKADGAAECTTLNRNKPEESGQMHTQEQERTQKDVENEDY